MNLIDLKFHTDNEPTIEACKRYWDYDTDKRKFSETVTEILSGSDLPRYEYLKLVKANSTAYVNGIYCYSCEQKCQIENRSDFLNKKRRLEPGYFKCRDCRDKEQMLRRKQEEMKRNEAEKNKRDILYSLFGQPVYSDAEPESLDFKTAIYFMSLLRSCSNETYTQLRPVDKCEIPLSPTPAMSKSIITHLRDQHMIEIDPETDLEHVHFRVGQFKYCDPLKVNNRITVRQNPDERDNFIKKLENILQTRNWPEHWKTEVASLCRSVAIEECLEFLQYQLHKRDFGEFSPGEKTMSTLELGLTHFTVAELYNLIGKACTYTGDAYVKKDIPKYRGKNRTVATLKTLIERARDNNWHITPWKRDFYNCPRSSISFTLFSSALHLDDAGFTELIDDISSY